MSQSENTPEPVAYSLDRLPWSRATSYRMERDGQLKLVRVRGRTFVTAEELRRILQIEDRP